MPPPPVQRRAMPSSAQPQPSLADLIEREAFTLEALVRELRLGNPFKTKPGAASELIEEIAGNLRKLARGTGQ